MLYTNYRESNISEVKCAALDLGRQDRDCYVSSVSLTIQACVLVSLMREKVLTLLLIAERIWYLSL